jgi:hypothetical protein
VSTVGPIIVWENYGYEGWQPRSFATIKEALETHRYNSEYVITRCVSYEVRETLEPNVHGIGPDTPEQAYERFEEGKEAVRKLAAVDSWREDCGERGRTPRISRFRPRKTANCVWSTPDGTTRTLGHTASRRAKGRGCRPPLVCQIAP